MTGPTVFIPSGRHGLKGFGKIADLHYQLGAEELVAQTLQRNQGVLNSTGALCIRTGTFTGRSPQDRYIIKDDITENTVHWNHGNIAMEQRFFQRLKRKMLLYLDQQAEIWMRDGYACSSQKYRLNIRIINETPWSNLFAYNMFLRPEEAALENFIPDWQIIHCPGFQADPVTDGTRNPHFVVISFSEKMILIGGTAYTGEIKKGIFSVLNYLLPYDKGVLTMHCSANIGKKGDVALFFGLSGTGKTTLSADPSRKLIGDDEHGFTGDTIFNLEGGCYAKCINLEEEKEPDIFAAIRKGALVENTMFFPGTSTIDFSNRTITENTRVSYPLHFIKNFYKSETAPTPKNIFFLTCDAYGILPPVSRLTTAQAMFQFITGYTAKIAGTENGITAPQATFSACFGAPFLPLHPGFYTELLGKKLSRQEIRVWWINTGWSGGGYGRGHRIKLAHTRAMISAVLNNALENITYEKHPVFGVLMPASCPGVPPEILNPRNSWQDKSAYDTMAKDLAKQMIRNFEPYAPVVSAEILAGSPLAD